MAVSGVAFQLLAAHTEDRQDDSDGTASQEAGLHQNRDVPRNLLSEVEAVDGQAEKRCHGQRRDGASILGRQKRYSDLYSIVILLVIPAVNIEAADEKLLEGVKACWRVLKLFSGDQKFSVAAEKS